MRVILADDSDLNLERLQEMGTLNKDAEIVGSFHNGTDTLEGMKNLQHDVAIVDIKMPGKSGLEVLHEIRKNNKMVKFIILSLFSSEHYRKMAIEGGADYFFSKADDFEKVSLALDELIHSDDKKTYHIN